MKSINTLPTITPNNVDAKTRRRFGRFVSHQLRQLEHDPANDDIDQIYREIKAAQTVAVRALTAKCH